MSQVREYILGAIQEKGSLNSDLNIDTINYVSDGYIDSMGLIKFVVELEEEFNIEFDDDELVMPSFKIVGELIKMVEDKIASSSS